MPIFYLDTLLKGEWFADPEGEEFSSDDMAIAQARAGMIQYVGHQMARGELSDRAEQIVRTEDGSEIAHLSFEPIVKVSRGTDRNALARQHRETALAEVP
jgi:hypothetical protein